MFAGIDPSRPWPTTGMTTERWRGIAPRIVTLTDLTATQDGISLAALLGEPSSWCGDHIPHVIAWNGRLWLEDGHHRALRAALDGKQQIVARVLDLDRVVPKADDDRPCPSAY